MAQKQYLDDNGNPVAAPSKVYLDDSGNPISAPALRGGGAGGSWEPLSLSERLTEIQKPDRSKSNTSEAVKAVGNVGAGAMGLLLHPIDAAKGMFDLINNPVPTLATMAQSAVENPYGFVESGIGQAAVAEGAGELAPRVARGAANRFAGDPRAVRSLVKKTTAENAADAAQTTEANRSAAAKHLDQTQDALHETAGRESAHAQAARTAVDEAKSKRAELEKKYVTDKGKAETQRKAAQEKYESAAAAQSKIAPTEQKLRTAWSNLRAGIETAREKALKIGNDKYNTVHETLNEFPADMKKVGGAYLDAVSSFGETQAVPSLLSRVEKAFKEGGLTYADEQKLYSDLGKELSKGTLPGTTFHAYDVLQESVGEDMQRIADSQGMGGELKAARDYWRRMKQTFGKPLAMRDAATGTLKSSASGLAAEDALQNQIRLLGSFDPDIPRQFTHVQNVEKGAESMPTPVPQRELTQKLAESRPALPNRPPAVETKPVAPPERVAPPDRPVEKLPAPKKIGAEEVKSAKAEDLAAKSTRIHHRVMWAAVTPTLFAVDQLVRFHGLSPAQVGSAAGATAGMTGVGSLVTRLFENPSFVEFMTNATPRDVAAIPPEIRGSFPSIIQQAQSRGVSVSPAMRSTFAGAAMLAPRQNETDAWAGQTIP